VDFDAAAVGLNDFVDDGQPQTGTGFFGAEVGIEDFSLLFRRHSRSCVRDPDDGFPSGMWSKTDIQLAAAVHGLDGVHIEVEKGLVQPVGIGTDDLTICFMLEINANPFVLGVLLYELQRSSNEVVQLNCLPVQLGRPGEFEEFGHSPVQSLNFLDQDSRGFLL